MFGQKQRNLLCVNLKCFCENGTFSERCVSIAPKHPNQTIRMQLYAVATSCVLEPAHFVPCTVQHSTRCF